MDGCQAEPPLTRGGLPPLGAGNQRFASVGTCTADCARAGLSTCTAQPAQQAVTGQPDGQKVTLGSAECSVLDVAFTGGTIAPRRLVPDVILHLGTSDAEARVRIEASRTGAGEGYSLVHWINGLTPDAQKCSTQIEGDRARLDLSQACTFVDNVAHLRLTTSGPGRVEIDAVEVEPCSFRLVGQKAPEDCVKAPSIPGGAT